MLFENSRLVIASNNQGKLSEIQTLVDALSIDVLPKSAFAIQSPEETAPTFIENALIKARHCAYHSGLPALADDSGLCVDYLNGEPGIASSQYAGRHGDDKANIDKLLNVLQKAPYNQRTARFHCLMTLVRHAYDPVPLIASGTWEGQIAYSPSGQHGFGYDPIFYVADYHCTAGELPATIKNQLSHRAKALQVMVNQLNRH
jgi:XTP/dITP diphosphohydrolase